jgi:N-methylhydantoinase A
VTDANAVLGYLNPHYLAGGAVVLDTERAATVLERDVATPLRLSLLDAAYGVHSLASLNMVRAVKAVSTFRGRDPRDSTLLAFGGNGPVCAAEMARALQMTRIVVPPAPGLFSAFGLLASNLELQRSQTCQYSAVGDSATAIGERFEQLEATAAGLLAEGGYPSTVLTMSRAADLRYADQGYELTVPVANGPLTASGVERMVASFEADHRRAYGHAAEGESVDVVNLRVTVAVGDDGVAEPRTARLPAHSPSRRSADRQAYFGATHGLLATPVITRTQLGATPISGPVIIEEYDATCVVPPDFRVSIDEWSNIVLES